MREGSESHRDPSAVSVLICLNPAKKTEGSRQFFSKKMGKHTLGLFFKDSNCKMKIIMRCNIVIAVEN